MRRAFIADWLALCGIGFGARTEALVLLEQERTELGVSSVVVTAWAAGTAAVEWAPSMASSLPLIHLPLI